MLTENCAAGCRRYPAHQAEAPGKQLRWQRSRSPHQHAGPFAVLGGRGADARREGLAKSGQAGEAHFHADIGHRVSAPGEHHLGAFQPCLHAELVRRGAEQGFKLANEVER